MDAPGGQPERSSAHPTAAALGGAPCALLCQGSAGDPTELGIKPSCRLPAGLWPRSYPVVEVLSWVTRNRLQDVRPSFSGGKLSVGLRKTFLLKIGGQSSTVEAGRKLLDTIPFSVLDASQITRMAEKAWYNRNQSLLG